MYEKSRYFFIVVMVIFGVCSAQRAEAQSANYAQRIIGTWTTLNGETWIFNANGTGTSPGWGNFKFAVIDTRMAASFAADGYDSTIICDISISSDGKTFFIYVLGINASDNGI